MTLATIDDDAWAELTHAATRALPRETGGLLLGYSIANQPHIARCLEIPDRVATAVRYRRDATIAAGMLQQAMAPYPEGLTGYIGEWHSHPAPVGPSDTDLLALRTLAGAGKHDVLLVVVARTSEEWISHVRKATPEGGIQRLLLRPHLRRKTTAMGSPINLNLAFHARQRTLSAELGIPLEFTNHPTSIGDASEANWTRMLRSYLPGRYEVGPVQALDITGGQSEQIDIAIYDRQYSPIWFESPGGDRIVPVESIYAVFEVKQTVNASHLGYASTKAHSVRQLKRTSGKIVDIHGTHEGPSPENRPILSGILALKSGWADGMRGNSGRQQIQKYTGDERVDMGLALLDSSFDNVVAPYNEAMLTPGLHFSPADTQLLWFCLRLFRRLQAIGTAPAVDLSLYEEALFNSNS